MSYKYIDELSPLPMPYGRPKVVVYTCNYNDYDLWGNYVSFSDMQMTVFSESGDNYKNIKVIHDTRKWDWIQRHSCILFPEADITIYTHGNLRLLKHPYDIVKNIQLRDMAMSLNDLCVYRQDKRYDYLQSKGLPIGQPNYANNFIIRRNNKKVAEMEKLWEETGNLSLAVWMSDIKPAVLNQPEKVFTINPHKKLIVPIVWGGSKI